MISRDDHGCVEVLEFLVYLGFQYLTAVCGVVRLAVEVRQNKEKMAKWRGKIAERLQVLEKRARAENIDTVRKMLSPDSVSLELGRSLLIVQFFSIRVTQWDFSLGIGSL